MGTEETKDKDKTKEEVKDKDTKKTSEKDIIKELKTELNNALEEVRNYKDKYLRTLADMDNQRKRMLREKEELLKYSNEQLILKILPVIDNFERALEVGKESKNLDKMLEGVNLIFKQLKDILEKEGVKAFESVGDKFDPYKHEALLAIESDEHEPSTVLEEIEKGYLLGDKVIRPAKVTVSKIKEEKEDDENGSEREGNRN